MTPIEAILNNWQMVLHAAVDEFSPEEYAELAALLAPAREEFQALTSPIAQAQVAP
jgi:hypothetical protein